jgi:hypothetical protein
VIEGRQRIIIAGKNKQRVLLQTELCYAVKQPPHLDIIRGKHIAEIRPCLPTPFVCLPFKVRNPRRMDVVRPNFDIAGTVLVAAKKIKRLVNKIFDLCAAHEYPSYQTR